MSQTEPQKFETKHWFYLIILIGLVGGGIIIGRYEAYKLDECAIETKAFLNDIYSTPKKGYFFEYTYIIAGVKHTANEGVDSKFQLNSFIVGDSILIEYACENAEICRVKGAIR
jgi:hypothetical protein